MKTSEVREALSLIKTGTVKWTARSLRVRFYSGGWYSDDAQYFREPEVELSSLIGPLSERLYSRDGFETSDHGRVSLTAEGERLLAELAQEQR